MVIHILGFEFPYKQKKRNFFLFSYFEQQEEIFTGWHLIVKNCSTRLALSKTVRVGHHRSTSLQARTEREFSCQVNQIQTFMQELVVLDR